MNLYLAEYTNGWHSHFGTWLTGALESGIMSPFWSTHQHWRRLKWPRGALKSDSGPGYWLVSPLRSLHRDRGFRKIDGPKTVWAFPSRISDGSSENASNLAKEGNTFWCLAWNNAKRKPLNDVIASGFLLYSCRILRSSDTGSCSPALLTWLHSR